MNESAGMKPGNWLIITYRPTTLFSLRMTHATSKGGKTLLLPTPYAVKLALIDACFRTYGSGEAPRKAEGIYEALKDKALRFRPPEHCVVQNTFVKVKQEERGAPKGIYAPTIAYREFCYFRGNLEVAIDTTGLDEAKTSELVTVAMRVNYFGKRGSFMQFLGSTVNEGSLPDGFTSPEGDADIVNGGYGTTHYLDDFGDALISAKDGFERINSYSRTGLTLGSHRVLVPTLLPYWYQSSGKHYTYYRRSR